MSAIAAAWYRFRATLGRRRSGYLGLAALIDLRLAGDFIWHEQPLRRVIRYD